MKQINGPTELGDFDLGDIRLPPEATMTVKRVDPAVKIDERQPRKTEFVRSHAAYKLAAGVVEDPKTRRFFVVTSAIREANPNEVRDAVIAVCCNSLGEVFVWVAKCASWEGDDFGYSRQDALLRSESNWIRLAANMGEGRYDVIEATGNLPEPAWPAEDLNTILRKTLGARVIRDDDHDVLQRLRGEIA